VRRFNREVVTVDPFFRRRVTVTHPLLRAIVEDAVITWNSACDIVDGRGRKNFSDE